FLTEIILLCLSLSLLNSVQIWLHLLCILVYSLHIIIIFHIHRVLSWYNIIKVGQELTYPTCLSINYYQSASAPSENGRSSIDESDPVVLELPLDLPATITGLSSSASGLSSRAFFDRTGIVSSAF